MKGEYMLYFLIAIQAIALAGALACTYALYRFSSRNESKYLLTAVMSMDIFGFGYLMQLLANNTETAIASFVLQYLGFVYVPILYSIFVQKTCRIKKIPTILWTVLFVFNSFVLISVVTNGHNNLIFTYFSYSSSGLIPHYGFGRGWLLNIFIVEEIALALLNEVALFWKNYKTIIHREKKRFKLMLGCGLLPLVGGILFAFDIIPGYDPSSLFLLIMVCIYSVTMINGRLVDVVSTGLNQAVMGSSKCTIITDENGKFLESNTASYELFPQLATWMVGRPISELENNILFSSHKNKISRKGKYYSIDKQPIVYHHRVMGYILVLTDITDSEEQVFRMGELKMAADEANNAKSRFLANMSHEMRTPLNAIIGMAALSKREKDPEKVADYVNQIEESGKMLLDIVCDVLDFSKAESGKLEISPVSYDLLELLNGVINVINMRIGEKGIDFMVRINPKTPRYLFGDDVRIRQVLINFLGNAEKFTDSGYIKLGVDYVIRDGFPILKMYVEDSGCGIKDEDIDKLFKVFSQVDYDRNRMRQGTGLGLAISGQIIELMNGKYHVTSEYGMGSMFSFEIPQKQLKEGTLGSGKLEDIVVVRNQFFNLFDFRKAKPKNAAELKEAEKAKDNPKYPNAAVLLVDDNEINIKVMSAMLELFDIKADFCLSGVAAIEKVRKREYNLILMDHMMPGMDGVETTVKIRELDVPWAGKIPIVACTANAIKGIDQLFLDKGMNGFISKPVILEELTGVLEKHLDSK